MCSLVCMDLRSDCSCASKRQARFSKVFPMGPSRLAMGHGVT